MPRVKKVSFMEPLDDNLAPATITVSQPQSRGQEYSPVYEWPGDSDEPLYEAEDESAPARRPGHPTFRLLALKSAILPKKQRIAVLDAYNEVQIGRDLQVEGSTTPRIRLKEMLVSKLHATMYWDGSRKEWNVVDMGSMHGTFLKSGIASEESTDPGVRLSGQRAASIPRQLRHLDQLTIGSTTFMAHIHKDERSCEECSVSERQGLSISLFPPKKDLKRSREAAGLDSEIIPYLSVPGQERDPKKALSMLKRSLLTRHDMSKHTSTSTESSEDRQYMDRAERRRMLFPASRSDSPGVPALSNVGPSSQESSPKSTILTVKRVVSAPATPLPSTNIGHQLLLRQGWTPGDALGHISDGFDDDRIGLVDPLELKGTHNRSGIGVKQEEEEEGDNKLSWKDKEKLKRYESIR